MSTAELTATDVIPADLAPIALSEEAPISPDGDDEAIAAVVTVWSKTETRCVQCDATKRRLDDAHIPYEILSLEENPEKLAEFKNRGFLGAPVVITAEETWAGFRPDLLDSTIAGWKAAQLLVEGSAEEFLERTEAEHAGDFSGLEENQTA